jgi:hypothetical protein
MVHPEPYAHVGATVTVDLGDGPHSFRVEDWWDRVSGGSWLFAQGHPAALIYAMRSGLSGLPVDDEVLYGKDVGGFGHLVHVSEVQS